MHGERPRHSFSSLRLRLTDVKLKATYYRKSLFVRWKRSSEWSLKVKMPTLYWELSIRTVQPTSSKEETTPTTTPSLTDMMRWPGKCWTRRVRTTKEQLKSILTIPTTGNHFSRFK